VIAPLYAVLRDRYPKLRMRVRFADDPMAGLLRDVDVAVCFGDAPLPEGSWIAVDLLRVREGLFASAAYLKARGTPRKLEALAAHEILAWDAPGGDAALLPLRRGGELAIAPALVASDIHLLRRCAAADLGIAFVPDAAVEEDGAPLVPVMADLVGRERAVRVVLPAALAEIPRIKAVLDEVRAFVTRARDKRKSRSD
jgi:DNA-binding transcriptional LysR family regulator